MDLFKEVPETHFTEIPEMQLYFSFAVMLASKHSGCQNASRMIQNGSNNQKVMKKESLSDKQIILQEWLSFNLAAVFEAFAATVLVKP